MTVFIWKNCANVYLQAEDLCQLNNSAQEKVPLRKVNEKQQRKILGGHLWMGGTIEQSFPWDRGSRFYGNYYTPLHNYYGYYKFHHNWYGPGTWWAYHSSGEQECYCF